MSQTKIAILYICTGDYVYFWEGFYRSFKEKFLPEAEKEFFVFTDADSLYAENDDPHIHRIYQENLGWPGNTLYRFRMFRRAEKELGRFDYLFFFNANTVCKETVTAEEFLPVNEELLVVQHPGKYNVRPYRYTYERRKESLAAVPYTCLEGRYYVYGAVNGGKTVPYLNMVRELERRIDTDYGKGIIATWHDESHLNRYVIEHPDCRVLSPAYAYPEESDLPFPVKITVLDKQRYIRLPATKVQVYERPVWYKRYAGYLKTYAERAGSAVRSAVLEVWFRMHGC